MTQMKEGDCVQDYATLGNKGGFSVFSFGNKTVRFRAPFSLERYTAVKQWDNGYLVVMAKYRHNPEPEKEYIDLNPILSGLYNNSEEFLEPIKEVKIENGGHSPCCG